MRVARRVLSAADAPLKNFLLVAGLATAIIGFGRYFLNNSLSSSCSSRVVLEVVLEVVLDARLIAVAIPAVAASPLLKVAADTAISSASSSPSKT